jgi:ATP-dependent protease ClpP protease subunit
MIRLLIPLLIMIFSCEQLTQERIVLTPENSVTLRTVVNAESVDIVIKAIAELDHNLPSNEPIYLVLKTPGGSVLDGNTLVEFIRGLKREVKTISVFAASMGFIIQQSAGERLVLENSILMAHPIATGCQGNLYDLRTCLKMAEDLNNKLNQICASRIGIDLNDYASMVEHEKWYIGDAPVLQGAADRVVRISCSKALMRKKILIDVPVFFGLSSKAEEFSACPLLEKPLK